MNRKAIIKLLLEALISFDIHPQLCDEILKIITGSGYEQRFFKLLVARLEYLSRHGVHSVSHEEFESIGDKLFSMHLAQKGFNIRILYAFLSNGIPTLLTCFYEREGKQKTDYTPYIAPARERLRRRQEDLKNGRS